MDRESKKQPTRWHRVSTPACIWALIATGLLLADLGWAASSGAKAIFASGAGPTVVVETPDAAVPPGRMLQPASSKTEAANPPTPRRERYIGFSYWVEVIDGDGQHTRLTTDQLCRRGDRLRLNIESNWNGYLYVVTMASAGHSQVLFPHPAVSPGENFVGARIRYEVPPDAHIRCDDAAGEEAIWVMLSPTPLAGITLFPSPQLQVLSSEDTARMAALFYLKGAKDLLWEVDSASPDPTSYAVAPLSRLESTGEMISVQVKLKHQ